MLGPKLAKTLHCFLTDREVQFQMDPNAAILHTEYDPTAYDPGMHCNCQEECRHREIKCQVFDADGRFPFDDPEVLDLQSAVLNFRSMAQSRLATFRDWSGPKLLEIVLSPDAALRREIAFYLRFRTETPDALWACVEALLDVANERRDHPARVETIESVAIWVAQERAVPREAFRGLLERLADPEGPVAREVGLPFTAALRNFLQDL
ncbi:MAG: hypothetical protein ACREJ2_15210 [Planctomycetota bacterium]